MMANDVGQAFGVPEGDLYIFLRDVPYNTGEIVLHCYHAAAIDIQQQLQPFQYPTTPISNYRNHTQTVFDCQDPPTEIAPERGVTWESTVFDCLDPDLYSVPPISANIIDQTLLPHHQSIHQFIKVYRNQHCVLFPRFPFFLR